MSKDYHIFTNFITTIAVIYYFSDKFYIANMGHIFYNDGNISQRRKLMTEKKNYAGLQYLLSYPENFDKVNKYPLVIFLHGAGTVAPDTARLEKNSAYNNICQRQNERGYVVMAPLCHVNNWLAHMGTLIELVNIVRNYNFIDITRVYLTGNSMGGYGTWELASLRPDWFASIMPVCGGAMVWHASRTLVDVPIRTFHGLKDTTVDPSESLEIAKAVNKNGGHCELILFPELSHNCWDRVYTSEANYDWMLSFTTERDKSLVEKLSGDYYG